MRVPFQSTVTGHGESNGSTVVWIPTTNAVYTATRLHNAVPNQNGRAPNDLWYGPGKGPNILSHLVQWGRIGYVTNRTKQPKLTLKASYEDGMHGIRY